MCPAVIESVSLPKGPARVTRNIAFDLFFFYNLVALLILGFQRGIIPLKALDEGLH